MGGVKTFEELECWQLGRELANAAYALTKDAAVAKDFAYVDQVRRAAISVMNNISEGHERGSNKDFVRFLYMARGSAGEVRNMLYIGLDLRYMAEKSFEQMKDLSSRTSKACYGLIRYLSKNLDWKSKLSIPAFLFLLPLLAR